jgi:predicted TIM-barrel fold metal-dependent hydrolase
MVTYIKEFPHKAVPAGAWDTHHHIFEPDRFPFAEGRHFTPARASFEQLQDFEKSIGVDHVCIAHGLSYGPDCTSLLYYLERFAGQARGICVLDLDTVTDELLDQYHAAGVRSVRLDFFRYSCMDDVDAQCRLIRETAQRLAQWGTLNWSIQIQQPHLEFWPRLRDVIQQIPIPVAVDHFALLAASSYRLDDNTRNIQDDSFLDEVERRGLEALCQTLCEGNLWIKLSAPYRCSNLAPEYADLKWLVRRLVDANPQRVLWGSDWPHTQRHKDRVGKSSTSKEDFLKVDDRAWIESMSRWLSEEEWRLMWVENPAKLYDYPLSA